MQEQQQAQPLKKHKNLFATDQYEIPKPNHRAINEYLTGLLIDGFDSFVDGVHVTTRVSFIKKNRKVLATQVSVFKEKTHEMVINIYHNDSYKVVCDKVDAITDYLKGKILFDKLRKVKNENNWI